MLVLGACSCGFLVLEALLMFALSTKRTPYFLATAFKAWAHTSFIMVKYPDKISMSQHVCAPELLKVLL